MKRSNIASQRLAGANQDKKPALDESVKCVLALKPILARILKGCIAEYAGLPVDDIEKLYIEGTPEVGSEPLHEDEYMRF